MSKAKEKNCRLCLNMLDDEYIAIDEGIRQIFEVLLLKIDLFASVTPLLCKSCMQCVQEVFDFKSTCISVNEQVVSLATNRNSDELDIRDIYLIVNENKCLVFNEDYKVCRFCLRCLEKSNFNLFNDLRKNWTDEVLLKYFPELDLNIIKEPVICAACMKSLESYHSLATKCQNTEENIMKYLEVQGAEYNGQICLGNVLKFLIKGMPEYIDNYSKNGALKSEDNLFENGGDTYSDINNIVIKIENDELSIKEENKYRECRTDENKCGETRWKEVVKYDMLTHEDSSDIGLYKCEMCTFETKHKGSLKRHMRIHKDNTEVTMYKCNLCSYESKWKSSLNVHMLTHQDSSNVVMYKCEKCTFETKRKDCHKKHILIHKDNSEVTMYKCNLCSYEAKMKKYLRHHMLTHKDFADVVMYRCERCTFETKYRDNLKTHMLTHKNKAEMTTYKCCLCSYEAKQKDYLRKHLLTHKDSSDVVMYKCGRCTFKTKRKDYLKRHMLIHKDNSEVNMYKCDLCIYKAKRKNSLICHMLTHKDSLDVVMHRCEKCTFETKYKDNLKKHMKIHKDNSEGTMCKDSAEVVNLEMSSVSS